MLAKTQQVKHESLNISDTPFVTNDVVTGDGDIVTDDSSIKCNGYTCMGLGEKRKHSFVKPIETNEKAEFVFPWKHRQVNKKPKLNKSKKQFQPSAASDTVMAPDKITLRRYIVAHICMHGSL